MTQVIIIKNDYIHQYSKNNRTQMTQIFYDKKRDHNLSE